MELAFNEKFPEAKSITWKKDKDKSWEVYFKIQGIEHSADFSKTGEWLETEKLINLDEVPRTVLDVIKSKYSQNDILKIYIEQSNNGCIMYEFEFKEFEVEIDAIGNYVIDNDENE